MGKRYYWHADKRDWLEFPPVRAPRYGEGPMVVGDIEPYMNTRGQMIGGRRQHKQFLKDAGMIEVGNERAPFFERKPEPMPDIKPHLKKALKQVGIGDG